MSVETRIFGRTSDGRDVKQFIISSGTGRMVSLIEIGACIQGLWVADRFGTLRDVVLGYDTAAEYEANPTFFGAALGRLISRMPDCTLHFEGRDYPLDNIDGMHMHGGVKGFSRVKWDGEILGEHQVRFRYVSPDGEEGYPGTLTARIAYAWDDDCCLTVLLEAACDAPTIVNLTNHSYWNLAGENAGSVLGHELRLRASRWLPTDETLIPTGELAGVAGTPMDFRTSKPLGRDIRADFPALRYGKGYDNCWAVDDWRADEEMTVAELYDPKSGRRLSVRSTQPGVQVYTGNWLAGSPLSKSGRPYADYDGVAIECQGFPDAPNRPDFPSAELRPGEAYRRTIRFRFDVR